jgi:putative membrane protein
VKKPGRTCRKPTNAEMRFISRILLGASVVLVTAYILPGINTDTFFPVLATALLISLLNAIVRPMILLLKIPLNLITFGLILFALNSGIILLSSVFLRGFHVKGILITLLFSMIISAIVVVMESMSASDSGNRT